MTSLATHRGPPVAGETHGAGIAVVRCVRSGGLRTFLSTADDGQNGPSFEGSRSVGSTPEDSAREDATPTHEMVGGDGTTATTVAPDDKEQQANKQ
jgi:hypothetical protein